MQKVRSHEKNGRFFLAGHCILPAPESHHAVLAASDSHGCHCVGLGRSLLGLGLEWRAQLDGVQQRHGLGMGLVRACGPHQPEVGGGALGHYFGSHAFGGPHVLAGRCLHDDPSLGGCGGRSQIPQSRTPQRWLFVAGGWLDFVIGYFGHGGVGSHPAAVVGAPFGHVVALAHLGLAYLPRHGLRCFGGACFCHGAP